MSNTIFVERKSWGDGTFNYALPCGTLRQDGRAPGAALGWRRRSQAGRRPVCCRGFPRPSGGRPQVATSADPGSAKGLPEAAGSLAREPFRASPGDTPEPFRASVGAPARTRFNERCGRGYGGTAHFPRRIWGQRFSVKNMRSIVRTWRRSAVRHLTDHGVFVLHCAGRCIYRVTCAGVRQKVRVALLKILECLSLIHAVFQPLLEELKPPLILGNQLRP